MDIRRLRRTMGPHFFFRAFASLRPVGRFLLIAPLAVALAAQAQQPPNAPPAAGADGRNPGVIQLMNQIETLQAEINRLRGQLEVLSNGLENAQKRQRDMYLDLDTRLRRVEGGSGGAAPRSEAPAKPEGGAPAAAAAPPAAAADSPRPLPPATTTTPAAPPVTSAPPQTASVPTPTAPTRPTPPNAPSSSSTAESNAARKAYDAGLGSYRSGDYQGAIAAFDGIVKRYPRDALAPNAQYWIGDAWFNLRDFRSAAAAQQQLVTNYPDSPKVPDALLNLSSAYAALGEIPNARRVLEELIARFPQSDAAEKGRQRLARLR